MRSTVLRDAIVMIPLVGAFLFWVSRWRRVVRRLTTHESLTKAIAATHDPLLKSQLLWTEYAMAVRHVRTGHAGAPSTAAKESLAIQRSTSSTGMSLLIAFGYAAVGVWWASLYFTDESAPGVLLFGVIATAILACVYLWLAFCRYAAIANEIQHARRRPAAERWAALLEAAAKDVAWSRAARRT